MLTAASLVMAIAICRKRRRHIVQPYPVSDSLVPAHLADESNRGSKRVYTDTVAAGTFLPSSVMPVIFTTYLVGITTAPLARVEHTGPPAVSHVTNAVPTATPDWIPDVPASTVRSTILSRSEDAGPFIQYQPPSRRHPPAYMSWEAPGRQNRNNGHEATR